MGEFVTNEQLEEVLRKMRKILDARYTKMTNLVMVDGGWIGQAAGPKLTFDDTNNYLEITGCNVGIGTDVPAKTLAVMAPSTTEEVLRLSQAGVGSWDLGVLDEDAFAIWDQNIAEPYFVIETGGNVGIGTTTPDSILHVLTSSPAGNISIITENSGTTVGTRSTIRLRQRDDGSNLVDTLVQGRMTDNTDGAASTELRFYNTQAGSLQQAMKIDVAGKIGMAIAAPLAALHLALADNIHIRIDDPAYPRNNYVGIENSDNLVLAADESNLGASSLIKFRIDADEKMRIDSNGIITQPYQPAFQAAVVLMSNLAVGSHITVTFGTENFDQNADFNTGTYTFTAPVTGKYQINVSLRLENLDTAATYYILKIVSSNASYTAIIDPNYTADLVYYTIQLSHLTDMDANDTVYITLKQLNGAAQTDVSTASFFSGYLVA